MTAALSSRPRPAAGSWPLLLAIVLTVALALASLFVGPGRLSPAALLSPGTEADAMRLLLVSRVPRTLAVLLAGSSLAVAGLVMQTVVRNRFVEPSTTGTMEAASLGFLLVTIAAPGWPLMAKMAVCALFALLGTALFLRILRFVPLRDAMLVPLVGLMLAGVTGALASFIAYRFGLMPSLLAWTMGDFSGVMAGRYELLWIGLVACILALAAADRLTVAGMGQDTATSLGLSYAQVTLLGLALVSVISAVTLVTVGSIRFLGLIVPNLASLLVGDNMRLTLPWVAVLGALFVLVCDLVGRLVRYPYEVPIGTVAGVVGGALFLWLILRRQSRGL